MTRILRRIVQPRADEEAEAALADVAAVGPSPEDVATQAELHRAIRAAIRSLPPKLRDALLLAQAGEYSYQEIGAMLGAPVGTIKWRVSEARRKVRAWLKEQGHAHE